MLFIFCMVILVFASCDLLNDVYDFYTSDNPVIGNNNFTTAEVVSEESKASLKIDKDLKIVALGDSITRGYGLGNPEKERFTALVAEQLEKIYNHVEVTNYAVDGMTSSGLLDLLESGGAEKLKEADIVMLCIGANNVLQYAADLFLHDNTDIQKLLEAYGSFLLGDRSNTDAPQAVKAYFEKVTAYASSPEFTIKLEDGLAKLREDIPVIISFIRKENPSAKIYFANVYSPYKGMNITLPYVETILPLGDLSDQNVEKINKIIDDLKDAGGYTVVDVYTRFKNSREKIINAGLDLSTMNINFDPHPNKRGHALIADEYISVLTEDYIP